MVSKVFPRDIWFEHLFWECEPLLQMGMKFDKIKADSKDIHVFPFNSEKKRGGVAVKRVTGLP